MVAAAPATRIVRYEPRGAIRRLFEDRADEILAEGPAGTGKSFGCLWKLHLAALKYPGMRGLILRKTLVSLTSSALVTFTKRVLATGNYGVTFYGGSRSEPAAFRYPNGSQLVVGGLDRPTKIMSSEYDMAYINEAIEVTEEDYESVTSRLRFGVMPYQQLIADCNPDAPYHWLNQRALAGKIERLITRHEDNPTLWDVNRQQWTERGAAYIGKLDRLTSVRYKRLRLGQWVAAEGQVYEGWDPALHVVERFEPNPLWPRYWAVDFGYTNPFVWQEWVMDPDGRLFLYREIYMTHRLVEDHALQVRALTAGHPRPRAVIADHDAEGRATFERYAGVETVPAHKAVTEGIQAVAGRLRMAGDGRPRLYLMRGALVERDPDLVEKGLPASTEEEFPSYVWDTSNNRKRGEDPQKAHDHGMDTTRYLVAHVDGLGAEDDTVHVGSYLGRRGEGGRDARIAA